MSQSCRTCKYLDVAPDKAGRIRPNKTFAYPCTAPIINEPIVPDSIKLYSWNWPPHRTLMSPDLGQKCERYEDR